MIPKFDNYHANMHSNFLILDKYIEFLGQEFFNGYVYGNSSDAQCYLMFLDGEPQAYLLKSSDEPVHSLINSDEFESRISENCFVSSYKCSPRYISFLSRCHTAKMIYQKLTSTNINPEKLIGKCKAGLFSGCIEGYAESGKNKFVYFDKGEILGTMNMESNSDLFEPDTSESVVYKALAPLSLNLYEFAKESNTIDSVNDNRNGLIQCYEEILQLLEKTVPDQDFSSLWRISAMELAPRYGFMDPFVAEFSYEDGKIDLWEKVDTRQAGKAMDEMCEMIAKKIRIPRDEIKEIKDKYINILSAYEIRN